MGAIQRPLRSRSDVLQLLRLGHRLELLQALVLDLSHALTRDVERAADLVERPRVLAAQAVPKLEHAALAVREALEDTLQHFLPQGLFSGSVEIGRAHV